MNNIRLNAISKRLDVLCGEPPPSFEQFAEMWQSADPLSRSLYELSLSSPELTGRPRYYERISEYLRRLGVQAPEPLDENYIKTLKSDD